MMAASMIFSPCCFGTPQAIDQPTESPTTRTRMSDGRLAAGGRTCTTGAALTTRMRVPHPFAMNASSNAAANPVTVAMRGVRSRSHLAVRIGRSTR